MRDLFFTGFIACAISVGVTLAILYTQFDNAAAIDVKLAGLSEQVAPGHDRSPIFSTTSYVNLF